MRRFARVLSLALLLSLLWLPAAASAQEPHPPHPDEQTDHRGRQQEDPEAEAAAAAEVEGEDGEEGEKDEAWDVSVPFGPVDTVTLDVTEGTWLNLDVSPDGREIVFDLLGNLYIVPIEGGEATALTSGLAWDMQPRYSPDGRHIAFTSDRAGGDNIWVLERGEAAEPVQVTKESFRLVNSPAWSPDGDWLAVRKHFTSQRSLGAGEIWMYHRTGSTGLQLTDRPNDQKDVGEPVFSPDGRYLYYSQDTTPGDNFEYNKDPNPGIYSILRLDLEEGGDEVWIEGAGGAVRPTPSPDGRYVGFLRRVRGENTLWLRHVESGLEWQVADGLDRDMQETWAIHGVYPTMAWTPDSETLVFWSGGGLKRLDVTDREAEPVDIPFHVRDTRQVIEPLRFPVEVSPETFRTKMLRWVTVSPAGDRVVYESLGKLWLRDLNGAGAPGPARRLTTQEDHFEAFPSWSRDGRSIVYVSWDDRDLATVRLTPARPGQAAGRKLTTRPGHYVEPVLSPDGATVVFRKTGGGYVTHSAWSADPGLYRVAVAGGEPVQVHDGGRQPHFGADSDRVYFLDFEGRGDDGPKRVLRSVDLDGSDLLTHVTSSIATELAVSPDGRYLAWAEGYQAYVTPLVATGRPVDVGAGAEALPVARVSSDAGSWIHWSGDGSTLYWALGPELFSRRLPDAFAFLPGAPEELPEPPAMGSGVDLSMEVETAVPDSRLALVGGRVVTMRGARDGDDAREVLEDGVVLVDGNRIAAVGARGEVAVPAGYREIDVTGKTLIPGLVDAHWHGSEGSGGLIPETNWENYASLAFGVTTLHDPSNDTATIFAAAEMARAGKIVAPRIFSTGTILYGAFGDFKATVNSLEDARRHLRRMKAVGAISVKSYNQPRREQRQQILQAARELDMMVVPEGGSVFEHNMTMVVDGHTGIEHSIPVAPVYEDVLQLWGATPVGYTPTLGVSYGGLWGENYWYSETNVWEDERLLSFVPREIVDARSRRRVTVPDEEWGHFANARTAKQLLDRGVAVQIGAHGQREGLAAHWEIWMLEQGGMTPWEALRAGTLDGARYLGLDGDVGSLEVGKLADVLILGGNPLEDIRRTHDVERVLFNGRLYDAATMDQIAPERVERPEFWWEVDPREMAQRTATAVDTTSGNDR